MKHPWNRPGINTERASVVYVVYASIIIYIYMYVVCVDICSRSLCRGEDAGGRFFGVGIGKVDYSCVDAPVAGFGKFCYDRGSEKVLYITV